MQDSFYKHHTPEELALAHANMLDFDHPDAIDMPMFASVSNDVFLLLSVLANDTSAWRISKNVNSRTYLYIRSRSINACRRPNTFMELL